MSGLGPLTSRELKKWYRNPISLFTGLIQPLFWLVLFGSAFSKISDFGPAILDGAPNYITYILGGVLTIIGLFTALFSGVNLIFDRRLGVLGRFLIAPIRRSSIVFAKIFSSSFRILINAAILIAAALIIPNGLKFVHGFTVLDALILVTAVILTSLIFSSIFTTIAVRITRPDTIFGIINLVNLPLLFVSYAMFPPDLMAGWLSDMAKYNPVSWSAETIRTVIINGSLSASQAYHVSVWLGGLAALAAFLLTLTYFVSEKEIRE
ncbi:MAG: ABC transporter permease [Candidatus Thermoplasmatota archaeon]|nr:ABC transporter permease [Candidatus Thermoplasmatota archaeon]MCL5731556.1 ABC transporter permease [Candidatus Thermoplasmatota archaeon]